MSSLARILVGAAAALCVLGPAPRQAESAEAALKIALVLPAEDFESGIAAEVSAGAALAVAASEDARTAGAARPAVEIVALTAGDAATAAAAVAKASKERCAGVVAFAAETAAAALEAAARKAKMPLVLAGPGGPARTLDAADPVLRVEPGAADRGLALAELLRLRSGNASIGLPAQTTKAWLVVEDAAWTHAVAASLAADDVDGVVAAGAAVVKPGAEVDAEGVTKARAAGCDRVVVLGGAKTVRSVSAALDRAAWDASVLCLDTALDAAAMQPPAGPPRKIVYAAAAPSWAGARRPDEIAARHPPAAGRPATLTPAAVRGFVATAALIDSAVAPAKKGVLAALREAHEGSGAAEAPLFDASGSVDHWQWSAWAGGSEGAAPVKAAFLPDVSGGLLLGGRPAARFRAAAGAVCVRVGFGGGGGGPPRTIEADLAALGLAGRDAKADEMVREQILGRTLGKLSRIWGRSPDGSARPALSWRIAFVAEGADAKGAAAVWEAAIAGDGPDGLHGGQSFPDRKCAQALSTYLLRNAAPLRRAKLDPPLSAGDAAYLDGSYAWNASAEGNARSGRIRALIDGVASTFSMKLSKEIGHLAGLGVDHSGDARSVMVARGGEGVSDEFAYFPPAFAKILEKTLGRAGAEGR